MKKNLVALVMGILMMTSIFAGCSQKKEETSIKDSNQKSIVYGSATDYARINPALDEHAEIHKLIFSGLTKHDENAKVVPALAKSWEYDSANMIYTFKLRDDVKWHDKKPFTAEDVKFTIEAIKNPDNNSEISANYAEIKEVEVVDATTVKIHLSEPCVPILDYLSVGMLPKHILQGKDIQNDSFNQHPIGTGAYSVSKWEMGQYIELSANKDYYEEVPKIEKVTFKILEDEKTRAMQLKSGEIDLAQLEPKDIPGFEKNEKVKLYNEKTADYRGLMFNFRNPILKDLAVRQAISYALDRNEIVDKVLDKMGKPAYGPLQMGAYDNANMEKYEFNPQKSKEILESAGWKLGKDGIYEKDGKKLSFRITCFEGDPVRENIGTASAQYLKNIGIEGKVEVVPQGSVEWDKLDTFLIGWGSPFDPDDHMYKVFHSSQIETGMNLNAYVDKDVDEALKRARTSEDDSIRVQEYLKAQDAMGKNPPFAFIAYVDAVYGANSKIRGIKDTVLGHHGVGFLWNVNEWDIEE